MARLTVIEPGMLTTVQDLGRPGHTALGVPLGGAADPVALRAGNRLLGNDEGAAGLECTLIGPAIAFDADVEVVVAGTPSGLPAWRPVLVRKDQVVRVGPLTAGARAYLCVRGGINVPARLGSSSTLLSAGFGGHEGRALRAGDRLELGACGTRPPDARISDDVRGESLPTPLPLRATDGPNRFAAKEAAAFWGASFTVSNQSNRVGIRLDGAPVTSASGEMTSEGAMPGAVQVTPSGQPIVLGPDHPTTGGYPIIACVASVDVHLLGRLRPGDRVRFTRTTIDEARRAFAEREARWSTTPP